MSNSLILDVLEISVLKCINLLTTERFRRGFVQVSINLITIVQLMNNYWLNQMQNTENEKLVKRFLNGRLKLCTSFSKPFAVNEG